MTDDQYDRLLRGMIVVETKVDSIMVTAARAAADLDELERRVRENEKQISVIKTVGTVAVFLATLIPTFVKYLFGK